MIQAQPIIHRDISLKGLNTFGVAAQAAYYFEVRTVDDLLWVIHQPEFERPRLILGGGSNMLLTRDFDGLVIKISLKAKWIEKAQGDYTLVSVMSGENWHEFVLWSLQHNLGGLENLSLIPGQVGSAPIQNIGAYGVELRESFHHLEALNLETGEFEIFTAERCRFGYRDSIFKNEAKGRYVITRLFLNLTHQNHRLRTSYGAIEEELTRRKETANIHSISRAVVHIRQSKLPDPAVLGNSGSFFKNPVIPMRQYRELKGRFPEMVAYPAGEEHYKLAAGWLIEKAGWKGHREGDVGVHQRQALVLVNYGQATGKEIEVLAQKIEESIYNTFGVHLEREVNII